MQTTKDRIIGISIELFNEKGCLNTSTRHIAEKLNISVGNLYYYFKNKEEIFKEVKLLDYEKNEIFLLKKFLLDNLEADIKYRFLNLELNLLVITFPKFKEIMQEKIKNEIFMIKRLLMHQIKNGYIKPLSENELDFFISNSWIVATSNLSFWNLINDDILSNTKKGALNMYYLIKPYLTEKSFEDNDIKSIEIELKVQL